MWDDYKRKRSTKRRQDIQQRHDARALPIIQAGRTAGRSLRAIAAQLDKAGVRSPGRYGQSAEGWDAKAVKRIADRHGIGKARPVKLKRQRSFASLDQAQTFCEHIRSEHGQTEPPYESATPQGRTRYRVRYAFGWEIKPERRGGTEPERSTEPATPRRYSERPIWAAVNRTRPRQKRARTAEEWWQEFNAKRHA